MPRKKRISRREHTSRSLVDLDAVGIGNALLSTHLDPRGCPECAARRELASDLCCLCPRGESPIPPDLFGPLYPRRCPGTFQCPAYRLHFGACVRCALNRVRSVRRKGPNHE